MKYKRPNKFRAIKTVCDGIKFDSRKEAARYRVLKLLERNGTIQHLEMQPRFNIVVSGTYCGFYKGDFRYYDIKTGSMVIEDVKGIKTPVYNLKKKLIKALYGFDIKEV